MIHGVDILFILLDIVCLLFSPWLRWLPTASILVLPSLQFFRRFRANLHMSLCLTFATHLVFEHTFSGKVISSASRTFPFSLIAQSLHAITARSCWQCYLSWCLMFSRLNWLDSLIPSCLPKLFPWLCRMKVPFRLTAIVGCSHNLCRSIPEALILTDNAPLWSPGMNSTKFSPSRRLLL